MTQPMMRPMTRPMRKPMARPMRRPMRRSMRKPMRKRTTKKTKKTTTKRPTRIKSMPIRTTKTIRKVGILTIHMTTLQDEGPRKRHKRVKKHTQYKTFHSEGGKSCMN